jgi:O-antigen ligase
VPLAAAALAAWLLVVGHGFGSTAVPVVAGWLILGAACWLGRHLVADLVPVALLSSAGVLVYLAASAAGGVGVYPNAAGALAVQMLALCLLAYQTDRFHPWRRAVGWMAAALAAVPLLEMSVAALAGVFLVVGAFALAQSRPHPRRSAVVALAGVGLLAVCVVAQLMLARGALASSRVVAMLSDRRTHLWHDALLVGQRSPWTGEGIGAFAAESPTAADPDTARAHSLALQTFAESGLVGVAVLTVLVLLVLWAVQRHAAPSVAPVALAAWTALCLQALIDYVTDNPMVLAAAGLVIGVAIASRTVLPTTTDEPDDASTLVAVPLSWRGR